MSIVERFERLPRGGAEPCLRVREGTLRDYDALARWHYRGGRPATLVLVLVAEAREETGKWANWQASKSEGTLARSSDLPVCSFAHLPVCAVLVVSMPTLNGRWRELAWPGRFSGDRRAGARRLNEEVRTISRVIVDPRWRGLGVATRLVREYLRSPLTAKTEAVAAMGVCCPFFEAAGMKAWRLGPDARGARLIAALRAERTESWELAGVPRVSADLERELRRWANASRATRGLVSASVPDLCRAAAMGLSAGMAYTSEFGACPHSGHGESGSSPARL